MTRPFQFYPRSTTRHNSRYRPSYNLSILSKINLRERMLRRSRRLTFNSIQDQRRTRYSCREKSWCSFQFYPRSTLRFTVPPIEGDQNFQFYPRSTSVDFEAMTVRIASIFQFYPRSTEEPGYAKIVLVKTFSFNSIQDQH